MRKEPQMIAAIKFIDGAVKKTLTASQKKGKENVSESTKKGDTESARKKIEEMNQSQSQVSIFLL